MLQRLHIYVQKRTRKIETRTKPCRPQAGSTEVHSKQSRASCCSIVYCVQTQPPTLSRKKDTIQDNVIKVYKEQRHRERERETPTTTHIGG